jgi:hypothetical protein
MIGGSQEILWSLLAAQYGFKKMAKEEIKDLM